MRRAMLKKIGLALGASFAILFIVIALQPADFRIGRSTTIAAPAPVVYGILSDFHAWDAWSPWSKLDPDMKKTWSGPPRGKGSSYAWEGNEQVGQGKMVITDVRENERVDMDLKFITPFEADNDVVFAIEPDAQGSKVTWTMSGKNGFMSKAFGLFMDVDGMVGKDFEKGLADLKRLAEAQASR
jgi:hypothetical protein